MANGKQGRDPAFGLDMDFNEALERFAGADIRDLEETPIEGTATPFAKWAGGKRSIINELVDNLPSEFGDYYEPFVGGGALFFHLQSQLKKAYLSDINIDLIFAYAVIKKDPLALIEILRKHKEKHNPDYYYRVRKKHDLEDTIEVAARFLYMNKTCFNGLYRVNKSGEFNVPVGKYKNPNIVQEKNIPLCNQVLQKAEITYQKYTKIQPKSGDFVYFDPPYHPLNSTSFTSYTKFDFTEQNQIELRDFALSLHKKGVLVMLSNSNTEFIRDLYKGSPFSVRIVHAPRPVNCKASGRNNVEEVLITTYG